MNARDVMTTEVVSVAPDMPVREIARLLLDKAISAVPVVDSSGAPIGMVSEGDLFGREEADREARRDWWLELLAEGKALSPEFLGRLRAPTRTARDVMAAPVATVGDDTEIGEIARLLTAYRIKRLPVVRDGRIVGIVGRADLVRALAAATDAARAAAAHHGRDIFAGIDRRFRSSPGAAEMPHSGRLLRPSADAAANAGDFRALAADHERGEAVHQEEERRAAVERRRQQIKDLIDHHVGDQAWRRMLDNAHRAAERGETEAMLLRFPAELCSDRGRAINVAEAGWPGTLRGEAAELYLRWERELKPNGFHLSARVLDFPGGMPGDIGLFLAWGQ